MSDLISRQAAIDEIEQAIINHDSAIMRITNMPSVDAVERKRGQWIAIVKGERGYSAGDFRCSVCGDPCKCYHLTYFCPNCGAEMRTKETDRDYERSVEQLEHDMLYEPTYNPDDGSM